MSYGITPYRVDISKIKSVIGSNDDALQDELIRQNGHRLDELDDIFDDMPSSREIVADVIAGNISDFEAGSLYWYVVEMLCEQFGSFMSNNQWYPASDDDLYAMKSLNLNGIESLPMPMDFPTVRTALRENFEELLVEAEDNISNLAMKRQFIGWVEQAKANNQDLMLFYY